MSIKVLKVTNIIASLIILTVKIRKKKKAFKDNIQ
jgi:hypothetical protein